MNLFSNLSFIVGAFYSFIILFVFASVMNSDIALVLELKSLIRDSILTLIENALGI